MNNNSQPSVDTSEKQDETRNFKETIQKLLPFIVPIASILLAFAMAFTPIWQLSFVVALFCGFYYTDMFKGCMFGMLSIVVAWTLYLIIKVTTSNIALLISQIFTILTGSSLSSTAFPAFLIIFLLIFIACIVGALGGSLGSGIRKLIQLSKKSGTEVET